MNILAILALAETVIRRGADAPGMLKIIFWILLILWAIGHLGFYDNPKVARGSGAVLLILFAILGYYTFDF